MQRFVYLITLLLVSVGLNAQVLVTTAPDFKIKDIDGELHHLYEYLDSGKHVVIDFFTTHCGPCQTYASHVSASYEYFGCNYGDAIYLGINSGGDNDEVRAFDSIWGVTFPSISGLQGGGDQVVDQFQVQSYPTVLLIAPDGSILVDHIWPPSLENINTEVLAAGVAPMICTVNTQIQELPQVPALSVTAKGRGSVEASILIPNQQELQLQVYGSKGRLAYSNTLSQGSKTLMLPTGFYIACLLRNGMLLETVKFIVH